MLRIHGTKLSQSKLSRMSWLGLAGAVSCCALVLVFGLMLFPSLPQVTYAAIPEPTPSTGTSVGINLPASIDFDSVTPTPDGATTTATADLTVTTTNSASYSLYLYSSDGDNSLRPKISANTSSIIATAGGVGLTLSSLKPNTWGYNLGAEAPTDTTTYSAVPTDNSTPIQTKDTSATNSANDTYTLSFGAKVDTTTASGAYSNTLTIAVVAEPAMVTVAFNGNGATSGSMSSIKIPAGGSQALPSNTFTRSGYMFNGWNTTTNGSGTSYTDGANYTASTSYAGQTVTLYAQWRTLINHLGDVTYMQDFTPTLCETSDIGATTRLIDRRDGKYYWVAKLADGNCWMTQNLDLDLTNGTPLTPEDSDVSSNWNPPRSTEKNGTVTSNSTNTETYSWDFGLYVKNNPDDYNSYCNQVKTMSGCDGWTDATNLTPAETEWTGSIDNTVSGNTYDAHFLIGNFYQWNAATAGTGGTITSQDATDSICPKGWQLPTSNNSNPGSFGGLVGSLNSTTITQAPYYFNPSGRVYRGSLWYAGTEGDYWSSTADSSTSYAYGLNFNLVRVNPSQVTYRSNGRSVRCLAR